MIAIRLIARLLDYPEQEFFDHQDELLAALQEADELSAEHKTLLAALIRQCAERPLLDLQSDYCELFDRGRATSLLLFEHVHGESRDRGQAMVDLLDQYRADGLELDSRELPDHLPLYLEYLAQGGTERVRSGLQDVAPILALLGARLEQRNSPYAQLFPVLLDLSGSSASPASLQSQVAGETRDDTPQALDAVWEEEQVSFIARMNPQGEGCTATHQRRFAGAVTPQYLDVSTLSQTRGE
ncbi:nitrate reductase molybdenum cofactor assembly chaperone [Erwinia sp. JUb26]|uniref:nitrate reductase molybdenum cofactor assembly chaperone n=1 Tax=Erwinia sp. JUb26 TaxID=2485126 RepID=UPI000F461B65|nr:nitrate reductase molybdenum cofactor assembly chaperone [Erwinia sp. JUb26]ROR13145.1 respiratory nitrate reductase chaperone NarJ [Erwinia sp. JUb26]